MFFSKNTTFDTTFLSPSKDLVVRWVVKTMGHALSWGFLSPVVVFPASRGFIVSKVITEVFLLVVATCYNIIYMYWKNCDNTFFKLYVVTISCTCIEITASILVVTACYKITCIHMYWDYKLYKFCENKFEADKNHILYRGCLFSEVNECDLDPCPENFTCNNTVGSFDCLYCNASSDNCTAGMLQFCYTGWLHYQNTKQNNNKNNTYLFLYMYNLAWKRRFKILV